MKPLLSAVLMFVSFDLVGQVTLPKREAYEELRKVAEDKEGKWMAIHKDLDKKIAEIPDPCSRQRRELVERVSTLAIDTQEAWSQYYARWTASYEEGLRLNAKVINDKRAGLKELTPLLTEARTERDDIRRRQTNLSAANPKAVTAAENLKKLFENADQNVQILEKASEEITKTIQEAVDHIDKLEPGAELNASFQKTVKAKKEYLKAYYDHRLFWIMQDCHIEDQEPRPPTKIIP
jgi:vacuolar-type H+-ATPase subunit I/STV1